MGPRASRSAIVAGLALTLVVMTSPAHAVPSTCGAALQIAYVSGPNFPNPGDVLRVQVTIGSGSSIQNGTHLSVNRVRFELDCTNTTVGQVPCTDDGDVIAYGGDATITTTCGVTWSSGHAAGTTPNEVVLSPSTPLVILPGMPSFCTVEFDVQVQGASHDATPGTVEQTVGYNASMTDAQCDNGLSSSGAQSGNFTLCPVCDDADPCTDDACDSATGLCVTTPDPTCSSTSTTSTITTTSTSASTTTSAPTTTTTSTSSSTTTTTLPVCSPPSTNEFRCEKGIAKALGQLDAALLDCWVQAAHDAIAADPAVQPSPDACLADAVSAFDATVARVGQRRRCDPDVTARAARVRDDALATAQQRAATIFLCPSR